MRWILLSNICTRLLYQLLMLNIFVREILCLETKFFAGEMCGTEDRLLSGCSNLLPSAVGRGECLVQCRDDPDCFGFHVDQHDRCFIHRDCSVLGECVDVNDSLGFVVKHCAHGGRWNSSQNRCVCVNGWVGEGCQKLPHTCRELGQFYSETNLPRTYLNFDAEGFGLAAVTCRVISLTGYSGIILLQNNGDANFNRTWEEYRAGFLLDENHFWSGLDSWYVLSRAGYNHVTITIQFKTIGALERHYYNFNISDFSGDFKFNFNNSHSSESTVFELFASLNFCLEPYQNAPFSAFNHDVDDHWSRNCALIHGSGWWFGDSCTVSCCNLFGRGPKHWNTTAPNQRIQFAGSVIESMMTDHQFLGVYLYLDTLTKNWRNLFF